MDYDELRTAIRGMTRDQLVYKVLKEEISRLGHWKNSPRGDPKKGWNAYLGKG